MTPDLQRAVKRYNQQYYRGPGWPLHSSIDIRKEAVIEVLEVDVRLKVRAI